MRTDDGEDSASPHTRTPDPAALEELRDSPLPAAAQTGRTAGAFLRFVDATNAAFAKLAALLALALVGAVLLSIAARAFGAGIVWLDDLPLIAFGYLVFLSLGPALQSGHHVTVELFDPLVPAALRRYLGAVSALAVIAFSVIFCIQLLHLTGRSFANERLAMTVLPIQLKWLQIAGPISVAQLSLTAVALLLKELRDIMSSNAFNRKGWS